MGRRENSRASAGAWGLTPAQRHSKALEADVLAGAFTPEGLLPVQIPADMDTVERRREDLAFDMECHRNSQGRTCDFGFGMNYRRRDSG